MKTLLINGKIASLDSQNTFYEAIGINGNKIDFLGSNKAAKKITTTYDEVISLDGKLLLPGFNDSHMHLLNYGYTLKKMDLTKFASIENMIEKAKDFIKSHSIAGEKWLLGRGWNQDKLMENRFPKRADLDTISKDIPILFTRTCGHISVCNTAALNIIDIEHLDENDPNIHIEDGIFQEDALNILYNAVPSPSLEDIKEMILTTCDHLLESGITSVQTDDLCTMPDQDYKKVLTAYEELNQEKKLPVRIYQQCLFFDKPSFKEFVESEYKTGMGDTFFKIGPLKLLLDGSLGARTALLREDYSDCPKNKGIASFKQEELNDLFDYSQKHGFQVAAHAIGDKAMDMFIDAIKKSSSYNENKDNRHGIVHAQITNSDILHSMKDLNLIAYVQPIFLDYDLHIVRDRVGNRADESYAFKTMYDLGIKVSGGSDAPVVDFNPFENIYSAVVRKDLNLMPSEAYLPKEKLSVTEALKAFTINGAYSSFEEKIKGSLEVGKLADLVVLSEDIFNINENKIKDIYAAITIVDGKIVYKK
ncbi:MAG: amidohydrolase [Marinisporobacter sp.]|jgi:predicted amidohydrolase YtcJ|nr:amidohydrolase [Marinisporobacter sp.]